jgi:hypothetical protein
MASRICSKRSHPSLMGSLRIRRERRTAAFQGSRQHQLHVNRFAETLDSNTRSADMAVLCTRRKITPNG